jgi:hypothetical protein
VRVGGAILEVTPTAHNGCGKFRERFGDDALRFVSKRELRHRNLRGIYMRVLEAGEVGNGESVQVIFRAPAPFPEGESTAMWPRPSPPGHRVRVALSTAYWPIVWPAPEPATLTVFTGASSLELPVRPPDPADADLPPLPPPEAPPPLAITMLEPARGGRTVHHDVAGDVVTQEILQDCGLYRLDDIDLTVQTVVTERYDIRPDDPLSARAEVSSTVRMRRGDWSVEARTRTILTATREEFRVQAVLDAFGGEGRVFSRSWNTTVPRDLV